MRAGQRPGASRSACVPCAPAPAEERRQEIPIDGRRGRPRNPRRKAAPSRRRPLIIAAGRRGVCPKGCLASPKGLRRLRRPDTPSGCATPHRWLPGGGLRTGGDPAAGGIARESARSSPARGRSWQPRSRRSGRRSVSPAQVDPEDPWRRRGSPSYPRSRCSARRGSAAPLAAIREPRTTNSGSRTPLAGADSAFESTRPRSQCGTGLALVWPTTWSKP